MHREKLGAVQGTELRTLQQREMRRSDSRKAPSERLPKGPSLRANTKANGNSNSRKPAYKRRPHGLLPHLQAPPPWARTTEGTGSAPNAPADKYGTRSTHETIREAPALRQHSSLPLAATIRSLGNNAVNGVLNCTYIHRGRDRQRG